MSAVSQSHQRYIHERLPHLTRQVLSQSVKGSWRRNPPARPPCKRDTINVPAMTRHPAPHQQR
ncbi:hypothetical protein E2C01_100960 [Portunus trituberculatus]|uniref:Uncharacterized protein n=1 Tax=Portunus trituberculatus TaxID=210409 RepID=A0A5B7KJ90_PORTR|nr:hypothetical protein [Portunus trituberculatus]